jgi:hypothetical protein
LAPPAIDRGALLPVPLIRANERVSHIRGSTDLPDAGMPGWAKSAPLEPFVSRLMQAPENFLGLKRSPTPAISDRFGLFGEPDGPSGQSAPKHFRLSASDAGGLNLYAGPHR